MMDQLITHAGTGIIGGLVVAITAFIQARAKREDAAADADKIKAGTDSTLVAHLIADVKQLKEELKESNLRHEECERRNAECDKNFAQLRHEFEIFRGNSMVPPAMMPPRLP
jgi:hypothetical protein